jgi:hypothetical protein
MVLFSLPLAWVISVIIVLFGVTSTADLAFLLHAPLLSVAFSTLE